MQTTFEQFTRYCYRLLKKHPEYAMLPVIVPTRFSSIDGTPLEYNTPVGCIPEAGHYHSSDYSDDSFQIAEELEEGEDINAVCLYASA